MRWHFTVRFGMENTGTVDDALTDRAGADGFFKGDRKTSGPHGSLDAHELARVNAVRRLM